MKKYIVLFGFFLMLISCNENYTVPDINCSETDLVETHTIQQIKEMGGFGLKEFNDEMIISGYVVSSDEDGNIYKSLYLQDDFENPNSAIKIQIDLANSYTKYPLGRKIFVQLQGLSISYVRGTLAVGKAIGGSLERIPNLMIKEHFFRSCQTEVIQAKKMSISEINDAHVGMLLQFDDCQFQSSFLDRTYANLKDTKSVELTIEQFSDNCVSSGEIILLTSGFSSFKSEVIPSSKGSIVAVLDKYYNAYQLLISGSGNVNFENERCDFSNQLISNISITELNDLYKGELIEFGVNENLILEGYVISSDEERNIENTLILQDAIVNPKAGIQLLMDKERLFETFSFGEKIFVNLNKLYLDKVDGKLTLGVYKDNSVGEIEEEQLFEHLIKTDTVFEITPKEITINELSNEEASLILTKVNNVQLVKSDYGKAFAFYSGKESAKRIIETCGEVERISVVVNGESVFSNNKFPEGKGSITGILNRNNSSYEIQLNYEKDVLFADDYLECPTIVPQIIITEIADPENEVGARFVELFNAGEDSINLSGWKLNKYINGASDVSSSGLELNGIIKPKEFYIMANIGFKDIFGFEPNIESSYISGTGDDVYELSDSSGTMQDVFGVIGKDGTGENWEYTDGRAIRKTSVVFPNIIFEINEWEVFSKSNGSKKTAPEDFNPGAR